jgi:hypothetical protein
LGLEVDGDSDEGAATLDACLKAYVRAKEDAIKKDQGHVIETPDASTLPQDLQDAPQAAQSPSGSPTPAHRFIRDLVPLWNSKAKPTANALGAMNRALSLLDESGIPTELATLKGIHGATFRDGLRDTEARGISQKTASEPSRPC